MTLLIDERGSPELNAVWFVLALGSAYRSRIDPEGSVTAPNKSGGVEIGYGLVLAG